MDEDEERGPQSEAANEQGILGKIFRNIINFIKNLAP
jgi:hypothetical protein